MNTLCLIVVCCLGVNSPDGGNGETDFRNQGTNVTSPGGAHTTNDEAIVRPANAFLSAPQTPGVTGEIPAVQDAVIAGDVHVGCGCSYCQGYGGFQSSGWVGNPYTKCSSCRRDGSGIWPYDYRRAFDYPWHAPNYAWGSPFVPQAWWPEVQAMYGPDYPYSMQGIPHHGTVAGDAVLGQAAPYVNPGELLPIPSPPFPTPMQRKIIRID